MLSKCSSSTFTLLGFWPGKKRGELKLYEFESLHKLNRILWSECVFHAMRLSWLGLLCVWGWVCVVVCVWWVVWCLVVCACVCLCMCVCLSLWFMCVCGFMCVHEC